MEPDYIDIHSHLTFSQFDEDREKIIADLLEKKIATITVGTDNDTSRAAVELASKHPHIFATIGIHPTDTDVSFDEEIMEELVANKKVVAIGECGLDYFRPETSTAEIIQKQKELFEAHIAFALKHDLPLMIHGRPGKGSMNAYEDILEMLEGKGTRGNVHFFVGTVEIAKRFLDLGYTLSFDGPVTFVEDYNETIKSIPLNMIMAETDAPYAAPVSFRGKRNEPSYVSYITDHLATIRGEDKEMFKKALVENAQRLFKLPKSLA